ncbi:unnamed protein product, partial [Meganyctiphanes norvegica]
MSTIFTQIINSPLNVTNVIHWHLPHFFRKTVENLLEYRLLQSLLPSNIKSLLLRKLWSNIKKILGQSLSKLTRQIAKKKITDGLQALSHNTVELKSCVEFCGSNVRDLFSTVRGCISEIKKCSDTARESVQIASDI